MIRKRYNKALEFLIESFLGFIVVSLLIYVEMSSRIGRLLFGGKI